MELAFAVPHNRGDALDDDPWPTEYLEREKARRGCWAGLIQVAKEGVEHQITPRRGNHLSVEDSTPACRTPSTLKNVHNTHPHVRAFTLKTTAELALKCYKT